MPDQWEQAGEQKGCGAASREKYTQGGDIGSVACSLMSTLVPSVQGI